MEILEYSIYGNSIQSWAFAAIVLVLVAGGLGIARTFVVRNLRRFSERTANDLDNVAAEVLDRTRFFFLLAVGVIAAAQVLLLSERAHDIVQGLAFLALLVQLAMWGNAAIHISLQRYTARKMEEDAASATTIRFLGVLLRLGLWLLIALVALDTMGIEITALVAGLGIGGIAVALAVQNVLGDLFGSLSIVLDKPFVVGDFIIVGDHMGTVERIGLKTTRLRSLSGEQLVFSNNDLLASRVRNYKRMQERRIVFSFGVVYQTPRAMLEKIPDIVREIIDARDDTRYDRAHFFRFGPSSLDFEVVYNMLVPDYNPYMDAQQYINLELVRRFEELGVEFAYPTQTIYLASDNGDPATATNGGAGGGPANGPRDAVPAHPGA